MKSFELEMKKSYGERKEEKMILTNNSKVGNRECV